MIYLFRCWFNAVWLFQTTINKVAVNSDQLQALTKTVLWGFGEKQTKI